MGMTLKELLTKGEGTLSAQEAKTLAAQCRMDVETLYTLLEERGIKIIEDEADADVNLDVDSIIAEVENAENNSDELGLGMEDEEEAAEENPADLKAAMDELLDDPVKNYLKQIGQIPLLSAEQEVELSRRIHAGAEAAHILQADRQKYGAPEYIKKNSARFSFEEDENSRSYTEDLDEDGNTKSSEDDEEKAAEEEAMEAVENGPLTEERRQERLARQAAMEEEEGKELILEPVEEPKKAGKKKKSRLLSHVESKADLNENDDTHQMEMPELSIHRGSVPAEEPEKTGPEMTRQAAEEAKKEKTSADHTRNPRSSCEEIEADIDGIRQEIGKKAEEKRPEYKTPPMNLLKKGMRGAMGDSDAHLREVARKLEETLDSFGVKVTVNNVSCGPTVTRYELMPEQGVKVSRIVGLTDDIKLSLAAADVRIEAPIPGKSAVGIEVPNKTNTAVMLRDLLETPEFKNFSSNLAFAVGKDIAGQPVIADIAKMPHLLIAGATGSGKSVCINTLIMSIIYKAKPEDVKLIMIDPKVVELSVYNGIPHLFIPVVTDPKKASGALNWAVAEMTDRYNKFAEFNVRDMKGYNAKVAELPPDENGKKPEKLPQIVIIVDELADLMMVCPGEVEESICRLAQLARAAGIHLIIATQRPSVDVITGLIKANMPSRVAFSVSSGVDSRTILDMNGAEKLLGKGDMLFYPQGYSKPARVQGAFVSDKEVSDVVDYLKNQALGNTYSNYAEDIEEKIKNIGSSGGSSGSGAGGGNDRDEYFEEAARFIIDKDKASIGMLQRVLKIGFNRAARIMDQLCEAGVVGPEEGTKPRKVLMTKEEFAEYMQNQTS